MNGATFRVRRTKCATCIYRKDSPLDLDKLEADVRDPHVGFRTFRACHHHHPDTDVCCRGFWNAHRDEFTAGQLAQRLGLVEEVDDVDAAEGDE